MVKLEIICAAKEIEKTVNTILKNSRTGYKGDGIIIISPIEKVLNIRTGKAED